MIIRTKEFAIIDSTPPHSHHHRNIVYRDQRHLRTVIVSFFFFFVFLNNVQFLKYIQYISVIFNITVSIFQVLWYRDTLQLDMTEWRITDIRGNRYTLRMRKVQITDFGNYSCVADNGLGKSKRSIELTGN